MSNRIMEHPILGSLPERKTVLFTFNEQMIEAFEGETVAAALLANGIRTIRSHEETGTPRGIYCNIGHCFECRITIDGVSGIRSCLTLVKNGIKVKSGQQLPTPLKKGVTP
ncbi:(2Fe-2S)-binding protein [Bacillus sp. 1P02SD]|uniref:(2Fe-2S)-binding protein n=1 Tax=Bacillus sp. 1P02SD TaxID=3132264 RepID=UPI0039A1FFD4